MDEIGFARLYALYDAVRAATGTEPIVLDAADLVTQPEAVVRAWCARVGIDYRAESLTWAPGGRPEWSDTARWHADVATSAGLHRYNIFDQSPEDELLPLCREKDIAVIARVPFDEGTLTGTLTADSSWPEGDWRNSYFVPENLVPAVARATELKKILPHGMTLPELALRFILACPDIATVIPGMRNPTHVHANLATSDSAPLSAHVLAELRHHRWDREPTRWSQ